MRLLSLAALLAPSLLGQDFRGQIKLKPLLPPLTQPWKTQPVAAPKLEVIESVSCSVPLLNVMPAETDRKMLVAPPSSGFHMRIVTPPAPPCRT